MEDFIKEKYRQHKCRSERKDIPFDLPFDWYREQMVKDDNWKRYGSGPGHLVWSRTCDVGGYWPGWCELVTWEKNQRLRNTNPKNLWSKFRKHSIVLIKPGAPGRGGYPPTVMVDSIEYQGWDEPAKLIGCHPRSLKNYVIGKEKKSLD